MRNPSILYPFMNFPGTSEILGLGRFRENPSRGNEAQIQVCIQEDIYRSRGAPSSTTKWIGVGQMNLLASANRFAGGSPMKPAPTWLYRGTLRPTNGDTHETLGSGSFSENVDAGLTEAIAQATGWLLRHDRRHIRASRDKPPVPQIVFLPTTELVRAFFAASSEMLKQLVDGRRDAVVARSRFSIDRSRCEVRPDGGVIIHADRKLDRRDALVVAMLLADRSDRLLRFHDSIHQRLITDPAFRTPRGAFLDANWPWPDGIEMEFEGRWFHRVASDPSSQSDLAPPRRFVITRIEKIFLPSPPTAIEVRYPHETKTSQGMPPPTGRRIGVARSAPAMRSDRVPDAGRKRADIETAGTEFPFAETLRIDWSPGHVYIGRKDVGMRADPIEGERFLATDDPSSGGDVATGHVTIRSGRAPTNLLTCRESDEARRTTWTALETLSRRKGWRVSYWGVEAAIIREFSYNAKDQKSSPPQVAIIDSPDGLKAVADVGSASGEPASLGVVVDYAHPSHHALARLVFNEAQQHGWKWLRKKNRTTRTGAIRVIGHARPPKCWESDVYYADMLERWLG